MKNVFITGGSGFIGRNIVPILKKKYKIYTPTRKDLNLFSENEVRDYILNNNINVVLHLANPNPAKNFLDKEEKTLEEGLRMFLNIYQCREYVEKIITLGSGAEYGKTRDIIDISEKQEGEIIPRDWYGLEKFIINKYAETSRNIYNMRLFGCFGPTDHESKFISHVIDCCRNGSVVTIRQNCYFDYIYVEDLAIIFEYFIENTPKYHAYNLCMGKKYSLEEIAKNVMNQMKCHSKIEFIKDGWNLEYTASNYRLRREIPDLKLTSLEEGISRQIKYGDT